MGEARQPPLSSPWPWTSKLSSERNFQTDHFVWQLMGAMSNVKTVPSGHHHSWRQRNGDKSAICPCTWFAVSIHRLVVCWWFVSATAWYICTCSPGENPPQQTKVSSQEHLRANSKGCRTVPTTQFSPEEVAVLQLDIQCDPKV